MMSAEMAYLANDYDKALELYKLLKDRASTPERRELAATGMLRSAAMANNDEEVILAATAVLADAKVAPELESEARQYLLSLKQNNQAEDDIAGMIESRLEKLNE